MNNGNINIGAVMISCEARNAVREKTMGSWFQSDWDGFEHSKPSAEAYPMVIMDHLAVPASVVRPQERQEHVSKAALERGIEMGWDYFLFLEDDLEFNRHFFDNLMNWGPMMDGIVNLASLYNPNVAGPDTNGAAYVNTYVAAAEKVYGSQAFLLSRACAIHCVENWWTVPGMQDIKISRLAAKLGPIYYHSPSLVQHTGKRSVWTTDGRFHVAPDFDPDWRWRGASSLMTRREVMENSYLSPALAMGLKKIFPVDVPVIDLGCGSGCYVEYLKDAGYDVIGVDGSPVADWIVGHDLSKPFALDFQASNILSIEVGEHIPECHADQFMDNVARFAKDKVVLSWAIPGQGGCGHVNEQPNEYAVLKLRARSFAFNAKETAFLRVLLASCDKSPWLRNTVMVFDRAR